MVVFAKQVPGCRSLPQHEHPAVIRGHESRVNAWNDEFAGFRFQQTFSATRYSSSPVHQPHAPAFPA